jgi:hypothetical protein
VSLAGFICRDVKLRYGNDNAAASVEDVEEEG